MYHGRILLNPYPLTIHDHLPISFDGIQSVLSLNKLRINQDQL
jgi:hypothetical protein